MIFLGINQDRYDCGVALVRDGHVVFAANEERFTRKKGQGGLPARALAAAFEHSLVAPEAVDEICVAGLGTPPLPARLVPQLHALLFGEDRTGKWPIREWLIDYLTHHTSLTKPHADGPMQRLASRLREPAVRRTLPVALRPATMRFVEHHEAHAAAARYLSGFADALALTADGLGDGLSITVSHWHDGHHERLCALPAHDSVGLFYEDLTQALGFIPNRHEGKVTGLAAGGDWREVAVPSPFHLANGRLSYSGLRGRQAVRWFRQSVCATHRREDVAAWAQHILEDAVVTLARHWLRASGARSLVVSGGVFANVALNRRLNELDEVDQFFVLPNMGDGGLALGAIAACGGVTLAPAADVFWGDEFSADRMSDALRQRGLPVQPVPVIEERIAAALARGQLVGRFAGRMEWGPRALGNRSVLCRATDVESTERLNRLLRRSDFMPFAPAVLEEDADRQFRDLTSARHASEFMTLCFRVSDEARARYPAVVHVDGTARAQLVSSERNPSFHRLLTAFKRLTGDSMVLNTSFNLHEEPIVRTPEEAVAAFIESDLDCLALGPFWVRAPRLANTTAPEGEGSK